MADNRPLAGWKDMNGEDVHVGDTVEINIPGIMTEPVRTTVPVSFLEPLPNGYDQPLPDEWWILLFAYCSPPGTSTALSKITKIVKDDEHN